MEQGIDMKILQLSDLHLFKDEKTKMVGINPFQSLRKITDKILCELSQEEPDLIVLTGDISQDFSLESYEIAKQTLQEINCPIVAAMGNHDNLDTFAKVFGNPTKIITQTLDSTNWQIILLNSFCLDKVEGKLAGEELTFLQEELETNSNHATVIFLHHHVLPVDSKWLDKINLQNNTKFLEIISKHKNVKAVISGHTHQDSSKLHQNTLFLTTPSTSWQFAVKSRDFKLDTLMPGYRWISIHADSPAIRTKVVRLDYDAAFVPDVSSKGY